MPVYQLLVDHLNPDLANVIFQLALAPCKVGSISNGTTWNILSEEEFHRFLKLELKTVDMEKDGVLLNDEESVDEEAQDINNNAAMDIFEESDSDEEFEMHERDNGYWPYPETDSEVDEFPIEVQEWRVDGNCTEDDEEDAIEEDNAAWEELSLVDELIPHGTAVRDVGLGLNYDGFPEEGDGLPPDRSDMKTLVHSHTLI
jgi:hypothetical protein